jgi:membrane-associated protein
MDLLDLFLHVDRYLNDWAAALGPWLYVVLFLIIFCETGLVLTPLLPGDSLLFAVGALAASDGSPLDVRLIAILLVVAAVAGDATNYAIGYRLGPRVFTSGRSRFFNRQHLLRTQRFYELHGGKTIILARFIPIVRTFAPFVAGIGSMRYARFAAFNVIGGAAWVLAFLLGGYYFGNLAPVRRNFQYVVLAIIVISLLPLVIEYFRTRAQARRGTSPAQ